MKELKIKTLLEMKDLYIGKKGTKEREEYEHELTMDVYEYKRQQSKKL